MKRTSNVLSDSHWMRGARCAGHPHPEWWTSGDQQDVANAVAFCERCAVQDECLAFALDTGVAGSVWGGATPAQRHRLLRGRRRS